MVTVGKVRSSGQDVGLGFLLTHRSVVTANHVIRDKDHSSLSIAVDADHRIRVVGVQQDVDLDVAVLELAEDVSEPARWAEPIDGRRWWAKVRWLQDDTNLTGVVSVARTAVQLPNGTRDIAGVQLLVDQVLHDYSGYSGSPVTDQDGRAVAVLVSQVASRAAPVPGEIGTSTYTNSLWAVPVADVVSRFGLDSKPDNSDVDTNVINLRRALDPESARAGKSPSWAPGSLLSSDLNSALTMIRFSPDASLLATADTQNNISIWNLAVEYERVALLAHSDRVRGLMFSADGSRFVSISGKNARAWEVADFTKTLRDYEHPSTISDASLSVDGENLAIASGDQSSVILSLTSDASFELDLYVFKVAFSPNGVGFVTFSTSGGVELWRMAGSQPMPVERIHSKEANIQHLAFSQHGRWLITIVKSPAQPLSFTEPHTVWVHDTSTGSPAGYVEHTRTVNQVVTSDNDELLATASNDKNACVWRIGSATEPVVIPHEERVTGVGFGPAASFLAVSTERPRALVWQLDEDQPPAVLSTNRGVSALAVSHDGAIATASASTAIVWRPTSLPGG